MVLHRNILVFFLCTFAVSLADENDRVESFPGQPIDPSLWGFKLYSGYLDIPDSGKRSLHYFYTTSKENPDTAPLVLWLNGGPGCSSTFGFLYENGPFIFPEQEVDYLIVNQYAWNNKVNVMWLEAPAPVGFSLYWTENNTHFDDYLTAHDNYVALQQFFKKFPDLQGRDFYITAESYGGIYGPTLAYVIDQWNKNTTQTGLLKINMKGLAIMNGVVNIDYDIDKAAPDLGWWHYLYGKDTREQYIQHCFTDKNDTECKKVTDSIIAQFWGLNYYDIYQLCLPYELPYTPPAELLNVDFSPLYEERMGKLGDYTPWCMAKRKLNFLYNLAGQQNTTCMNMSMMQYFLRKSDVRAAFNIPPEAPEWYDCSQVLVYDAYGWGPGNGVSWIFEYFLKEIPNTYKILSFSGDTDACVPIAGTRKWVSDLKLNVTLPWSVWYADGDLQAAGFREYYKEGFEFVSVLGTGHMSVAWKKYESLSYIMDWIFNKNATSY